MNKEYSLIIQQFRDVGLKGEIKLNEALYKYTTWKIGGIGETVIFPKDKNDILITINLAKDFNLPITFLGNGSNVLIKDGGIKGITIISTGLQNITIDDNKITAECGIKLPKLARIAADNMLSGLEFAVGIPGTIGGAVGMNAGAHNECIGNLVRKVRTVNTNGVYKTYDKEEMGFGYRNSILKDSKIIILEVDIVLRKDNKNNILKKMNDFIDKRKKIQPLNFYNAGSVFKNTENYSAGYLIDKAGAKGLKCGSAQVSLKHANFIVNIDNAKAKDVLKLIDLVKEKVKKEFGITLEEEIEVFGED
jgi:UDP-N-acetylmuramate dehydrogenase